MSMKALRAQSKASAASRLARMGKFAKGATSDGDADDKPAAKAKKAAASVTVDGKPSRPRLDRPGRRMRRADGGDVDKSPANPGEVSNEQSTQYLRNKASGERMSAIQDTIGGTLGIAGGTGLHSLGKGLSRALRGAGRVGQVMGGGDLVSGAAKYARSRSTDKEADKFDGKKRGGPVRR